MPSQYPIIPHFDPLKETLSIVPTVSTVPTVPTVHTGLPTVPIIVPAVPTQPRHSFYIHNYSTCILKYFIRIS